MQKTQKTRKGAQKVEFELQPGAWFIADAHYTRNNPALFSFLDALSVENIPPQMILMGDIFDLLFGKAPNSIEPNLKMVDLLKRISRSCEMIYLEGNHDFGLASIFGSSIRVVERKDQPVMAHWNGKRVALHHGDMDQGAVYEIYTALIRTPWIDRFLNGIDTMTKGSILRWLEEYNGKKDPCYRIDDFQKRMEERLEKLMKEYAFDVWIEGHFHQDVLLKYGTKTYVNLPAFACRHRIVEVVKAENGEIEFVKQMAQKGSNVEK